MNDHCSDPTCYHLGGLNERRANEIEGGTPVDKQERRLSETRLEFWDRICLEDKRAVLVASLRRLEYLEVDVWEQAKLRADIEAIDERLEET